MSLTTITAAERAERARAVTTAIHSGEMEGLPMTEATRADSADYVAGEITDPPKPTRDLTELRAIHRTLFGPIYGWAGELRTVDIRKNVDGGEYFVPVSMIERAAHFTFTELATDAASRLAAETRDLSLLIAMFDRVVTRPSALH